MSGPSHIEEVPPANAAGPSHQEIAESTDEAVFNMMTEMRAQFPGRGGAIVAGTCSGLARYQLQGMPPGSTGQQVLEVVAPVIRQVATQIAEGLRRAAGLPVPKVAVVPPMVTAQQALQKYLAGAPVDTICLFNGERLLLISYRVTPAGVLSHASVPSVQGSIERPADVIMAHCTLAVRTWTQTEPADLLAKIRDRLAQTIEARADAARTKPPHEAIRLDDQAETLRWVIDQYGQPDPTPEENDDADQEA